MKKFFKILGIILLSIVGILSIGLIVVAINSPGRLEPLKDSAGNVIVGSLAEKNFTEIGGIRQGYFVRAENPENPVILFLHGGPGSPSLPFQIPRELPVERLERYFTMVYWEQRGAGMSFSTSIDSATMTLAQFVEDTRQMTEHLRRRFNQEKIFLMGHSWGTFLGVKAIEQHPELFHAYIAIAQVTNQRKSEKLLYDFLLQHAKEIGNQRAIRNLQRFDRNAPDFPTFDYIMTTRSQLMNEFGVGIIRENFSMSDIVSDLLFFRGYTLREKINYGRGSLLAFDHLWHYVVDTNLFETYTEFEIPVFITHGVWDYQVSYTLAREWFDVIDAPKKAFFSFENSAHSPNMEEPEKFVRIVREIVEKRQ
jgi:pimeloyl-ACP methyl ester carboxylesterase